MNKKLLTKNNVSIGIALMDNLDKFNTEFLVDLNRKIELEVRNRFVGKANFKKEKEDA